MRKNKISFRDLMLLYFLKNNVTQAEAKKKNTYSVGRGYHR